MLAHVCADYAVYAACVAACRHSIFLSLLISRHCVAGKSWKQLQRAEICSKKTGKSVVCAAAVGAFP